VVKAISPRTRIILGRPDGRYDDRIEALAAGGLKVEVSARIRDAVREKLVSNPVGGALCTLNEASTGQSLAAQSIEVMERRAGETALVAAALGGAGRLRSRGRPAEIVEAQAEHPSGHKVGLLDGGRRAGAGVLELARMAGIPTLTLELLVDLAVQRSKAAGLYQDKAVA